MSMEALLSTGSRLCGLSISVGSGELVGRYAGKLPYHTSYGAGIGALAGIIQYSLHYALEPAWTAIKLSSHLNPLGQFVMVALQILVEAFISALAIQSVFNCRLSTFNATVLTAESTVVASVITFLINAGWKALT